MGEGAILDSFPYQFQPPLELAQFVAEQVDIDHEINSGDIFLYHGTNCYRRWEIKHTGFIQPGRSNYSFFCTKQDSAFAFARTACLRDMANCGVNSLICEPVVLKVRFNPRSWLQVDFWQSFSSDKSDLSLAVLGSMSADLIVDVLHCAHNRRFTTPDVSPFTNDSLFLAIQKLRAKFGRKRLDIWAFRQLLNLSQNISGKLTGHELPKISYSDALKRIRQTQTGIAS